MDFKGTELAELSESKELLGFFLPPVNTFRLLCLSSLVAERTRNNIPKPLRVMGITEFGYTPGSVTLGEVGEGVEN